MIKPMWDAKAVKAYETGQGVELVNVPHPHYRPLPEDLNPDALEAVEIDLPQRTWQGLTDEEIEQGCKESWITEQAFQSAVWWAEAKLKEKNT
jgi:hypothetical protein